MCVLTSGFDYVFVHTACARLKGAMPAQLDVAGPLAESLSLTFCFLLLSTLSIHRQHGGSDQG